MDETERAIVTMLKKAGDDDCAERASRAREAMEEAFAEAVVSKYERHGQALGKLPDEGDRHVIAAAIKAKADFIVTENLKDFPRKVLANYGIEAKSSDEFLADAINLNPSIAIAAIKRMRLRFRRPDMTPEALLLIMEKIGLTQSSDQLKDSVQLI